MKKSLILNNSYLALPLSLLWVMVLYSLCRLLFYAFNLSYFPEMTWGRMAYFMWGGLRFGLAAILFSILLFIFMMLVPFRVKFHSLFQKISCTLFKVFV